MHNPVGVFDSGVGGLSVLREIRRELPAENLLYVADSAFAPYGEKPAEVIQARAMTIARWLENRRATVIVVACNTATGVAVEALRASMSTPIVGIEPAVKPAALETRTGVIGVLATIQTLASSRFERLVATYAADVTVLTQPCPGLVELVENGEPSGVRTQRLIERYVRPLVEQGVDTLVLGCTHFPFLAPAIQTAAGPSVQLIDPAVAVAREVRRRLRAATPAAPPDRHGAEQFWTSGNPADVRPVIARLWGRETDVGHVPEAIR